MMKTPAPAHLNIIAPISTTLSSLIPNAISRNSGIAYKNTAKKLQLTKLTT
jgi:hypothetical protein